MHWLVFGSKVLVLCQAVAQSAAQGAAGLALQGLSSDQDLAMGDGIVLAYTTDAVGPWNQPFWAYQDTTNTFSF